LESVQGRRSFGDGGFNVTDTFKESSAEHDNAAELVSQATHWAFINDWRVEPQFNDRTPVMGEGTGSLGSPSARRSTARRKHQARFKEWSGDRHD